MLNLCTSTYIKREKEKGAFFKSHHIHDLLFYKCISVPKLKKKEINGQRKQKQNLNLMEYLAAGLMRC